MEKLRSKKVPQNSEEGANRQRKIPDSAPLIAVLILMIMYFSFASEYFLQVENFRNILANAAVTGIVCIPSTFLIIAGHIDLSVGSAAAVSGMILAQVVNAHGIVIGLLAVLLFGLAFGCFNGVIVTMIGVNSLITTLGGLGFLYGVALLIGNGQTVGMNDFEWLGTAQPVGIPLPVVIFAGLAFLGAITLRYTKFGRSIYAIGSNPNAARVVGIRSNRIIFQTFVLSAVASALAGAVLTSQLSAGSPNSGLGLELQVVTAIVLGGASLAGGRGSIFGTVLGLLIVGVLNNGLILMDVPSFWQRIAQGLMLIIAVSFDSIRAKLNNTRA
ncbi:MAG: ABC transporter permease [Streptomycetaceae bacterium]|nr:ABC transporter permease [Streptomycetaceae bacterium]